MQSSYYLLFRKCDKMGGRGASAGLTISAGSGTTTQPQQPPEPQKPKTASEAKDMAELRQVIKDTLGVELGKSLDTIDFGLVKQAAEDLEFFSKEFPQWAGTIKKIQTRQLGSSTNAQTNGTNITLSKQQYGNPTAFATRVANATSRHYYPEGTTNKTTAVHEMGHTFEQAMIDKIMPEDGTPMRRYDRIMAWNKGVYSGKIILEAVKAAKKTPEGKGKLNSQLISDVSGYATTRRSETLAECVRDYYINKDKAQPLSKEVWKILKREFG